MKDTLKDKMLLLKEELYKMLDTESFTSQKVIALSQELDKIINKYNPKAGTHNVT